MTKTLNLQSWPDNNDIIDEIDHIIEKYKNYQSILKINDINENKYSHFDFQPVTENYNIKEIAAQNTSKTDNDNDIPPKVLKDHSEYYVSH